MSLIHKLQNGCSVSKHESNINPIRALGDKVPCQWAVIFDRILSFLRVQFSSVQSLVMSDSLRPHELQHARPPCPTPTPGVHSDSRPSSQWCHLAISSSVIPFSSCTQSLPASVFSNESTLCMKWPKYWSFSFSIIVGSPWSPRDSQESSPTPQFKSINSSALSFLHGPTLGHYSSASTHLIVIYCRYLRRTYF